MFIKYFSIFILTFFSLIFSGEVVAQEDVTSSGLAVTIPLEGDIEDGTLICTDKESIKPCDISFNASMYGVVVGKPATALESDLTENAYLVVASGKAMVRVSTVSGKIKAGELLTSSDKAGIAVKADRNGYVLGTALGDYEVDDPDQIGQILVSINVHPSSTFTDDRSNLLELLRKGLAAPLLTPLSALRYIMAGFVTIVSFLLGFIYFGRLAKAAIDAIGRNPLAHKTIQLTVVFHIFVTVVIVLAGIGIAYLILAL